MSYYQNPPGDSSQDLGPLKPYPVLGDKCRTCSTRKLKLIHIDAISPGGELEDTLVCEACDTPDPRWTIDSLGLAPENE